MKHIFKHKENGKLYTIEHFIYDIKFLNNHENTGIFAYPYYWDGKIISYTKGNCDRELESFNPEKFIEENFEIYSELY